MPSQAPSRRSFGTRPPGSTPSISEVTVCPPLRSQSPAPPLQHRRRDSMVVPGGTAPIAIPTTRRASFVGEVGMVPSPMNNRGRPSDGRLRGLGINIPDVAPAPRITTAPLPGSQGGSGSSGNGQASRISLQYPYGSSPTTRDLIGARARDASPYVGIPIRTGRGMTAPCLDDGDDSEGGHSSDASFTGRRRRPSSEYVGSFTDLDGNDIHNPFYRLHVRDQAQQGHRPEAAAPKIGRSQARQPATSPDADLYGEGRLAEMERRNALKSSRSGALLKDAGSPVARGVDLRKASATSPMVAPLHAVATPSISSTVGARSNLPSISSGQTTSPSLHSTSIPSLSTPATSPSPYQAHFPPEVHAGRPDMSPKAARRKSFPASVVAPLERPRIGARQHSATNHLPPAPTAIPPTRNRSSTVHLGSLADRAPPGVHGLRSSKIADDELRHAFLSPAQVIRQQTVEGWTSEGPPSSHRLGATPPFLHRVILFPHPADGTASACRRAVMQLRDQEATPRSTSAKRPPMPHLSIQVPSDPRAHPKLLAEFSSGYVEHIDISRWGADDIVQKIRELRG